MEEPQEQGKCPVCKEMTDIDDMAINVVEMFQVIVSCMNCGSLLRLNKDRSLEVLAIWPEERTEEGL